MRLDLHITDMSRSWLCVCCMLIAGTTPATGSSGKHPGPGHSGDSLNSLRQVKAREIMYLAGSGGEGSYRLKAVRENDKWVEAVLAGPFEPVIREESEALTMNVKLNAFAADLRRMAVAFCSAGSRYEKSPELQKRIVAGMESILKYFNPEAPRPGNWYQWLISLPNNLGATTLLMESFLPPELLNRLRVSLRDQLGDNLVLTGTNAAWESRNHIYLALLDNDPDRLRRAADYVFRTVRYGTEQGVREDYCYLFHGRIPYAGAYGAGFAQTIAEFIYVFDTTPYAISPVHLELIMDLLLEHTRWFLADGQIGLHVRGRTFKSKGSWGSVLEALLVLAQTTDPRSREAGGTAFAMLQAKPDVKLNLTSAGFADRITAGEGGLPQGFRYWPSGEIGVFRQASFHVGFRQYSNRVQDYEYLNREDGGEGEEGWNLAYGFTNILREDGKGSWYSESGEMFPEIDMEHLPGTTSRIGGNPVNPKFRADPDKPTKSTTGFSLNFGKSPFAGGAGWKDGGVAGFILEPAYGDFTAKKSLHFFPGGFWALGSNIVSRAESEDPGKPLHTTLVQWVSSQPDPELVLAVGTPASGGNTIPPGRHLVLSGDTVMTLEKAHWFWLKGEQVAVIFNRPERVFVRLKGKVITAWLDHGEQPRSASYEYAVLPDATLEAARRFARELPFRPVRNDGNVHAVEETNGHRAGVIFFAPDSCLGVTTRSPVSIYRRINEGGGVYTVQDPLHLEEKMQLRVEETTGRFNLPDPEVQVKQSGAGVASITVSTALGRIYRLGYGTFGQEARNPPRKDLDIAVYRDFKVIAKSDRDKTILTVRLPGETAEKGYKLSVHFSKSQRLHDFTDEDIIDRPAPGIVRYRWDRGGGEGPSVFSDYWKLDHGHFKVYLLTGLIEKTADFYVPDFDAEE